MSRTTRIAGLVLSLLLAAAGGSSAAPRSEKRVAPAAVAAKRAVQARPAARPPVRRSSQRTAYNFDWDDNAVTMVTKLHLVSTNGGPGLAVSTAEFAMAHGQLGKPGKYQHYKMGSLAHTLRETRTPGMFRSQLAESMRGAPGTWQGPAWSRFVEAMADPGTARETTIITARSSDPQEIHNGLRSLKRQGIIKHVPRLANIYPVNSDGAKFAGKPLTGKNTAEKKSKVMVGLLRELNGRRLPTGGAKLRTPDGEGFKTQHMWGFSDDDWHNYEAARTELSARAHEFPNVKIKLFYTGTNDPKHKPETVIIHSGGWRPERADEQDERAQVRAADQRITASRRAR